MTNAGPSDDEPWSRPPIGAVIFCLLALAALIAALFAAHAVSPAASTVSQVRIRNNTPYPFQRVVVNGRSYGDIDAGASSAYRTLGVAYRYASFEFVAGTDLNRFIPEDYTGEAPLGSGRFTYVLSIGGRGQFELTVEEDGP